MAAAQENSPARPQLCSRRAGKPETSFIVPTTHIPSNFNTGYGCSPSTFSQKVTLTEEPRETVTVTITFKFSASYNPSYYISYGSSPPHHYCNFNLTFDNNLHEISQDYVYYVKLNMLKVLGNKYHVNLFAYETERSGKVIFADNLVLSNMNVVRSEIGHFCFRVRRFNKKDTAKKDFSDKIGTMLLKNELCTDVSLIVGDRTFPAHKYILSSVSDVFKAMFTHSMKENKSGIVKIDDIDADVIDEILCYIYTGKTKNMAKLARQLYAAANKYQILDLTAKCEEHFIFNLNNENVIDLLEDATLYNSEILRSTAMIFVGKHENEIVTKEQYKKFLCNSLSVDTVVSTLILCAKYDLKVVKTKAFEFVKKHQKAFKEHKNFLDLFDSYPGLAKEFVSMCLGNIKCK